MNISETVRNANAIVEAWMKMEGIALAQGISFTIKAENDITDGRFEISPLYRVSYRTISVTVVQYGKPMHVLEVTLMKAISSSTYVWESAAIEVFTVGNVYSSERCQAQNTPEGWVVRKLDLFAEAQSCGHFQLDYARMLERGIRAELPAD